MAAIIRVEVDERAAMTTMGAVAWLFIHRNHDIVLTDAEVDQLLDSIERQRAAAQARKETK